MYFMDWTHRLDLRTELETAFKHWSRHYLFLSALETLLLNYCYWYNLSLQVIKRGGPSLLEISSIALGNVEIYFGNVESQLESWKFARNLEIKFEIWKFGFEFDCCIYFCRSEDLESSTSYIEQLVSDREVVFTEPWLATTQTTSRDAWTIARLHK